MGCSVLATALAEVCAEGRLDFRVRASFTCCLLQLVQHRRAVWCRERLGCVHATLLPFARNNTEMKLKPSQDRIHPCVGTEAGAAPAFALHRWTYRSKLLRTEPDGAAAHFAQRKAKS